MICSGSHSSYGSGLPSPHARLGYGKNRLSIWQVRKLRLRLLEGLVSNHTAVRGGTRSEIQAPQCPGQRSRAELCCPHQPRPQGQCSAPGRGLSCFVHGRLGNSSQKILEKPKTRSPRWPGGCPECSCFLACRQGLAGSTCLYF